MGSIRYDVQPSITPINAIQLIYCSLSRYDDTWQSVLHSHSHAELFYCIQGHGTLQMEGEKLDLDGGDFFLINPSVEHTENSDSVGKLEYIVIGVSGVCFLAADGTRPPFRLIRDRANHHEFLPYFQDMLREMSRQREGYLSICESILSILFAKAGRSTRVDMTEGTFARGTALCEKVKGMIDERYSKNITLDQLAAYVHISKYHLAHMFKQHYGLSPIQHLCERRVQEARHLLINTDYSLSQICGMVGFSSPSYFSQAFRRVEGMSPNLYRKTRTKP